MLVLSRKAGEKIVVNGDIVLTIIKIDRHQVRLGIDAPQSVPVYRQELLTPAVASPELQTAFPLEGCADVFIEPPLEMARTHSRSHAHAHSQPHPRAMSKPNSKLSRFCSTTR